MFSICNLLNKMLKKQKKCTLIKIQHSYIHCFRRRWKQCIWQFSVCVCIYICFLSQIVYINYPYTNSCSFLGFPVPGLKDPRMGINTEGLLPVWSLEILACGGESVQFHTNTTALSVPHPLPNPQFRHSHLQFWLCSSGGSTLHFLHIFLSLPQRKDIIFSK